MCKTLVTVLLKWKYLFWFETQGSYGYFKIFRVDFTGALTVKQVERFFDVIFLLLAQFEFGARFFPGRRRYLF